VNMLPTYSRAELQSDILAELRYCNDGFDGLLMLDNEQLHQQWGWAEHLQERFQQAQGTWAVAFECR
jgi:hypothetical protein